MKRLSETRGFGGNQAERPQLTSMVDMLTILIVFLLQSFSDDGSLLTPAPGVGLPLATSGGPVPVTLSIEVTESAIRVDGVWVCATSDVEDSDDPVIASLGRVLEQGSPGTDRDDEVRGDAAADGVSERPVLIQCDRSREFAVLKKVLRTCAEAGYGSPGLLVERSAS